MPTLKKRINITADSDVESAIIRAAKRDKMPVAAKAASLLRLALEIEEDSYLASIAESRMKQKVKYISHESFWKRIGK